VFRLPFLAVLLHPGLKVFRGKSLSLLDNRFYGSPIFLTDICWLGVIHHMLFEFPATGSRQDHHRHCPGGSILNISAFQGSLGAADGSHSRDSGNSGQSARYLEGFPQSKTANKSLKFIPESRLGFSHLEHPDSCWPSHKISYAIFQDAYGG
jgi:hypothetical protein